MTISSLQDLNNYALTPITYTDVRPAAVFFDRGTTVPQSLSISENNTYIFPWGINIEDITQFDVALVEYVIDLSNHPVPVTVTWDTLPAHVTVNRVNNIWTVSGIRSRQDWLLVRQARAQPPFGFSGLITHTGSITFFADSAAQTRTSATWTVSLTVVEIEYFSAAPLQTYTANEVKSNFSTTSIIAEADEFDPVWTLRITASDPVIDQITADAGTWNNLTKEFVVTGSTTVVNSALSSLDIDFNRSDKDFNLFFILANNFTASVETQIQVFESRDFISDNNNIAAGFAATANMRFGLSAPLNSFATLSGSLNTIFEFKPTTYTIAANTNIVPNAIFDHDITASASFGLASIINVKYDLKSQMQTQSTLTCEAWAGEAIEYTLDVNTDSPVLFNMVRPAAGEYVQLVSTKGDDAYWEEGSNRPVLLDLQAGDLVTYKITGYTDNAIGLTFNLDLNSPEWDVEILSFGDFAGKLLMGRCINITSFPNTLAPSFTNLANCFTDADTKATAFFNPVASWNVSNVTNMSSMFKNCDNFNTNINSWNTSSVTSMNNMFEGAITFNQSLNSWDTSSVTNMNNMFEGATAFNQSLNSWDTSSVESFTQIFKNADSFNGSLAGWDFASAGFEPFFEMFAFSAFNNSSIANWNLNTGVPGNIGISSLRGMFRSAGQFNSNIDSWDVSNISDFSEMFFNATAFNQDIGSWDVGLSARPFSGPGVNLTQMFFNQNNLGVFNQDIGAWDTSKVTSMVAMFQGQKDFNQDIGAWDTSNVTSMTLMFNNALAFDQDISGWCVEEIPSKPSGFDTNTPATWIEAEKPNWGAPC